MNQQDGTGPVVRFPVVAIGASAGGLAALKTFVAHVPKDGGVAYVVVVHLSARGAARGQNFELVCR